MYDFSQQELMDCCTEANGCGCDGCNGGNPYYGFEFTTVNNLVTYSAYPYQGAKGACNTGIIGANVGVKVRNHVIIQ